MLGPFEGRTDEGTLADVPGARLRGLLIALALEPARAVGGHTRRLRGRNSSRRAASEPFDRDL
jgi:hypothetical protein